ncbi:hypothetical protein QBC47DRAFT_365278 [Echria macrotheca]|uniref:Uncharacterized protein n=1 Tax=Echria macrotheca TaxID=438768 RepID=A0AAJ0F4J1_9PEZI|nr:hypothetical protein QBC47DRAFT_365278 [Echria macrotheca]
MGEKDIKYSLPGVTRIFPSTPTPKLRPFPSRLSLVDTDGLLVDDIVVAAHRCYLESVKAQKEALANPQDEIDFLKRTVSALPRVTKLVLSSSWVPPGIKLGAQRVARRF